MIARLKRPTFIGIAAFLLVFILPGLGHAQAPSQQSNQDGALTVLHLLDYIGVDYAGAVEQGQIKNPDEYSEMREFSMQARSVLAEMPANAARLALLVDADLLVRGIEAKRRRMRSQAKRMRCVGR